jgi:hypothetical protein
LWDNYPHNKIEHTNKDGNDEFKDHCAINISHSLFLSGVLLDNFKGAKCYANCPLGKNQHSLRAEELANWLSKNKKKFNLIKFHELNGENFEEGIKSKTGIIFFKDYWRRDGESGETRTGDHIDLWNKNELAGEGLLSTWARLNFPNIYDFFGSSDLRRSKTVWLWEIK